MGNALVIAAGTVLANTYLSGPWSIIIVLGLVLAGFIAVYLTRLLSQHKSTPTIVVHLVSICLVATIIATKNWVVAEAWWAPVVSYGSLIVAAAMLAVHGPYCRVSGLAQGAYVGVLVLAQGVLAVLAPGMPVGVYGIITSAGLAGLGWRLRVGRLPWFVAAAAILTLSTATSALVEGGAWTWIFLVLHVGVAAFGALARHQWVMWWGTGATIAALLYFLRGYVVVWLVALELGLIGLVVWRLMRPAKVVEKPAVPVEAGPVGVGPVAVRPVAPMVVPRPPPTMPTVAPSAVQAAVKAARTPTSTVKAPTLVALEPGVGTLGGVLTLTSARTGTVTWNGAVFNVSVFGGEVPTVAITMTLRETSASTGVERLNVTTADASDST